MKFGLCRIRSPFFALAIFFLAFGCLAGPTESLGREPMAIPGKEGHKLYQRVLTHPGAPLHSLPSGQVLKEQVPSFTVYYVFDRKSQGGVDWVEVGPSSTGTPVGWMDKGRTSDWNQAMTLAFSLNTGREPVLFFNSFDSLNRAAGAKSVGAEFSRLAREFENYKQSSSPVPPDFPILTLEPKPAVPQDRFYLMPIFDVKEPFQGVKFLEVGCIDPGSATHSAPKDLKTGIAFVIDTTKSMGPYIDRSREVVHNVFDQVEKSGLSDKVAFAMVAYRNDITKTPALEYDTKVISDFRDGRKRDELESALSKVKDTTVSSHSFDEEAFAGIETALDKLNWSPYAARLIFLITDAGAVRPGDPLSITHKSENAIADLAKHKGVHIFVFHLKTPAGKKLNNHSSTEKQYMKLAAMADKQLGPLYQDIQVQPAASQQAEDAAGKAAFGKTAEAVANNLITIVKDTAEGRRQSPPDFSKPSPNTPEAQAARKAAILGYALQLDFLGARAGTRAPAVVKAWVADVDAARLESNQRTPLFNNCLLMTKNQLSDLKEKMRVIIHEAEVTKKYGTRDLFNRILSASAQMSRDPIQLNRSSDQALGKTGILAYLEGLPYKSLIMQMTEEHFYGMPPGDQVECINDWKSKMAAYEKIHNNPDKWVGFGDVPDAEKYTRISLSLLP